MIVEKRLKEDMMREVTLEKVAEDFEVGYTRFIGSKHGIEISYKDFFKTFYDFCEYVKESGYIIV